MIRSAHLMAGAALVAMAGCAAKLEPPPVVDIAAMACPSSLALDGATPLLFDPKDDKITSVVVDAKARCLQEGEVRSLYQVFALPAAATPYIITVRTIPWANTIMAPRAQFLDRDGKQTRLTSHADFTFRGQTLSALLRSHDGEAFLVVQSDPEVLGGKVTRIVDNVHQYVGSTGAAIFYVYTGSDVTNEMILSGAGRVEVTISPLPTAPK